MFLLLTVGSGAGLVHTSPELLLTQHQELDGPSSSKLSSSGGRNKSILGRNAPFKNVFVVGVKGSEAFHLVSDAAARSLKALDGHKSMIQASR